MEQPQNHIWGPALWLILHSSAERIGTTPKYNLPHEETRIWIGLLNSLRYSLPCPLCKKHYTSYLLSKPIYSVDKASITTWLFQLHTAVNNKLGRENPMTMEQSSEHYSKEFDYNHCYRIIETQMNRSLQLNISQRDDVLRTLRYLKELQRLYL
jgi:hypothetical protein